MPITQILLTAAAQAGGGGGGGPVADFTVEWWQKVENSSNNPRPWSVGLYPTQVLSISYESLNSDYFWINSSFIGNTAKNHLTGNWEHMALVRQNNVFTAYFNGVAYFAANNSDLITSTTVPLYVGTGEIAAGTYRGYITDLHIMKGYAKYNADFSPPSSPVVGQDGSKFLLSSVSALSDSVVDIIGNKTPSVTGTVASITDDTPYAPVGPYTMTPTAFNVPLSVVYLDKTTYPDTLNIRPGWYAESANYEGVVVNVENPFGDYYAVTISVPVGELDGGQILFSQPPSGSFYFNGSSYLDYGASSDWAMDVTPP